MQIYIIALIIFLLTACSPTVVPASDPTQIVSSIPPFESLQPTFVPTQGDSSQMFPTNSTPPSESEKLIQLAMEELAQRLSIPIHQISLAEIEEAEWSDSSLDCPQPGMSYLQVITPGYRILLEADGNLYEYHSNKDSYIIFCANSIPLIPPPSKP